MSKDLIVDRGSVVSAISNLSVELKKFGYDLRGLKLVLDHDDKIQVYSCRVRQFVDSLADGSNVYVSLFTEVDE